MKRSVGRGLWAGLTACLLPMAACTKVPVAAFDAAPGFRVLAEGDSGQTVSGTVSGPEARTKGLKVALVHVIRTLAEGDVTDGKFSLPLPALVPAYPEDVLSQYDDARAKLAEKKPLDPKYQEPTGWPFFTFDGFWLLLYEDKDGDGTFTRGTDREVRPVLTYYLVYQGFEDSLVTPFKKGWYVRYMTIQGHYRRQQATDALELQVL